jgi:glycosyltransferase involved in cell wall biosynthesis
VSHPIPYQVAFFRQLEASPKLDFVALFGSDFGTRPTYDPQFRQVVDFGMDLLSGFSYRFVPQVRSVPRIDRIHGLVARAPGELLDAVRPDAIILHGWATAMMWQVAAAAHLRKIPYFMRAETPDVYTESTRQGLARTARRALVTKLITGASAVLALGAANERFYASYGYKGQVRRVPYFVDNDAVARAAASGRARRTELRASLGIPADAFVIVAVGKLMPRKRATDVVHALTKLDPRVHALWVGSGELEEETRREAAALGVADRFHLAGFRPAEITWNLLGASDLFVMPSEKEPWGLAINEAVAAGLPTVVSSDCGAAEDLVATGRSGTIVPPTDVPALTRAIDEWFQRFLAGSVPDPAVGADLARRHSIGHAVATIETLMHEITRN